jgi:hypothetical protein
MNRVIKNKTPTQVKKIGGEATLNSQSHERWNSNTTAC